MGQKGKRPWLAALLGTLATGLGHFYLRRWKRGLGWFGAAVVASFLFVPPETAQALLSGEGGTDLATLAPVLAVSVASIADAYVIARNQQRRERTADERRSAPGATGSATDFDPSAAIGSSGTTIADDSTTSADCPNCGKELDPDLDFCPWCTTRLGEEAGSDD